MNRTRARSSEIVERLIEMLELRPHPEGGHFIEHYRAVDDSCTAIYYLLRGGTEGAPRTISAWHKVAKDELWHHYQGAPLALHLLDEQARTYQVVRLGRVESGQWRRPCHLVPAGVWQAATVIDERAPTGPKDLADEAFALIGNTVAPGFDMADWTLADEAMLTRLAALVPDAAEALRELAPPAGGGA
jgi:uncharacterized protein